MKAYQNIKVNACGFVFMICQMDKWVFIHIYLKRTESLLGGKSTKMASLMIKTPVTEYFEGIGNRRFPLSLLINFVYLLCREKCMGNHIYYIRVMLPLGVDSVNPFQVPTSYGSIPN